MLDGTASVIDQHHCIMPRDSRMAVLLLQITRQIQTRPPQNSLSRALMSKLQRPASAAAQCALRWTCVLSAIDGRQEVKDKQSEKEKKRKRKNGEREKGHSISVSLFLPPDANAQNGSPIVGPHQCTLSWLISPSRRDILCYSAVGGTIKRSTWSAVFAVTSASWGYT